MEDSNPSSLVLIFKDVVEDALLDGPVVAFIHLVQQTINQLCHMLWPQGMKVGRDELEDVIYPVLSDGRDHIDWDQVLNVLGVTLDVSLSGLLGLRTLRVMRRSCCKNLCSLRLVRASRTESLAGGRVVCGYSVAH